MIERMMQSFSEREGGGIEDLGLKQNVDEKNLDLDCLEKKCLFNDDGVFW